MPWDPEPRRIGTTRSATVPKRPVAARFHHAAGWKENQFGSDALRQVLRTQPRSGSWREHPPLKMDARWDHEPCCRERWRLADPASAPARAIRRRRRRKPARRQRSQVHGKPRRNAFVHWDHELCRRRRQETLTSKWRADAQNQMNQSLLTSSPTRFMGRDAAARHHACKGV
jgi:hypothetical protein